MDNLPDWLPPGQVSQLVQGSSETIGAGGYTRDITLNCTPESPYQVGTYDEVSRYDTPGSTLAADITTTGTTLSVATIGGVLWSTTAEPYDINCGGEQMRVTSCTGASSPQSMTVQRSINGAVMTHGSGDSLSLWTPAHYAL